MNVHRTERMESKGASENAVRVGGKERVNPNVLIYTYVHVEEGGRRGAINNHHKYFGRHISRLVCQHWDPPFAILSSLITRGKENKEGRAPWPSPPSFHLLIKIIMTTR